MCENRFYICEKCGNLVGALHESGVPMMCCGQKMTQLEPGTVEASHEKHIPVATVEGRVVRVEVGEVAHPMTEEHHIGWVYLQTDKGGHRKCLGAGDAPVVSFTLTGETPIAVYAYCNLHGLWKADVEQAPACDLPPVDVRSNQNYTVCRCNKVSYFDILDQVHKHNSAEALLSVFEDVKNTTHCSAGCGGCYDKVLTIISAAMND